MISSVHCRISACTFATDASHSRQLQQPVAYVKRQWLDRHSLGPYRLCVRDNRARTNNILESYHSGLCRRIQVSHPNLFNFWTHLQNVTVDNMAWQFLCAVKPQVSNDDDNDGVNVDEQQQQQQQQHIGPATSSTAATDTTSARSTTCEVCLLVRHFPVRHFRSRIFSRLTGCWRFVVAFITSGPRKDDFQRVYWFSRHAWLSSVLWVSVNASNTVCLAIVHIVLQCYILYIFTFT